MSTTRDNHYVQQALMRRWSKDLNNIWVYRTLVSHPRVPQWQLKPIKGLAVAENFYTVFSSGHAIDAFEKWIQEEFEDPGIEATNKLVDGTRLTPLDWTAIQNYVAAQDLRTPRSYLDSQKRLRKVLPSLLNQAWDEVIEELSTVPAEETCSVPSTSHDAFSKTIHVQLEQPTNHVKNNGFVRASVRIGRKFWTTSVREQLLQNTEIIHCERWSVVEPFGNEQWPLTDHPVVRLNFYQTGKYNFHGGWGMKGSEILMPVSPRHLLYAQVGSRFPNRFTLSSSGTYCFQRFLLERAHRFIFAADMSDLFARLRPRVVDPERFRAEQNDYKKWQQEQVQVEALLSAKP